MSFRNPFRNKPSSEPPLRSISSPVESTEYVALPQNAQASSEHCDVVYAQASEVTSDCSPIARLNSATKQLNQMEAENRDLKLKVAQLERDLAIESNRNRELQDKQALDIAALKDNVQMELAEMELMHLRIGERLRRVLTLTKRK